jgi:hypothetical protein
MARPVGMIAKATLRPGQKGTKRLLEKYGDRLVCVRYRYDSVNGKRYTTVELLEAESHWTRKNVSSKGEQRNTETGKLSVRSDYWETDLREKAKQAGAVWRPRRKLWEMAYEDVMELGLENRVVSHDGQ